MKFFILLAAIAASQIVAAQPNKIIELTDSNIESRALKLQSMEKDSSEYQIESYKLAIDITNTGKSLADAGDSARALQLLTYGVNTLPWRGDLRELHSKVFDTFKKVTTDLMASAECSVLEKRIQFASKIVPDYGMQLRAPSRCHFQALKNVQNRQSNQKENVLLVPSIEKNEALESRYTPDLSGSLLETIERNKIPVEDLIILEKAFIREKWKDLYILCPSIEVDENTTSTKNFKINLTCYPKTDFSASTKSAQAMALDNVQALAKLIENPKGKIPLTIRNELLPSDFVIKSTTPVVSKFPSWFLMDEDTLALSVIYKTKIGESIKRIIRVSAKMLSNNKAIYISDTSQMLNTPIKKLHYSDVAELDRKPFEFNRWRNYSPQCIFNLLDDTFQLTFDTTDSKELAGLDEIIIKVDMATTLKHFEDSVRKIMKEGYNPGPYSFRTNAWTYRPTLPNRPSFDCAKASTEVEKKICGNRKLSNLDKSLAENYADLKKIYDSKKALAEQRVFIEERNKCTSIECLTLIHRKRIVEIKELIKKNEKPKANQ